MEGYIIMAVLLAILSGYITASIVLLKYPQLLHKRKKQYFKCRHISHRGGAGEHLENTMTAFRNAVTQGTEMLEIDCQITRDGKVVVSHDDDLNRVCGVEGAISQCDYDDLPPIKQSLSVQFKPECITQGSLEDRRIPLLEDVFKGFPELPINIDIKRDDEEMMTKVHELIINYNREKLVAWGNGKQKICDKLYRINPNISQFTPFTRVVKLVLLFYTGLLPFVPIREDFYEVIMPSSITDSKDFYNSLGRGVRVLLKVVDFLLISKIMFGHLERRGMQIYLWVLNEDQQFDRALTTGATGIMTDYPSQLKRYLDTRDTGSAIIDYGAIEDNVK